jgi:hypothetical protein
MVVFTPERLCGIFVLAQGDEIRAEAAVLDHPGEDQRQPDQCKDDPIERRAALELERLRTQVELDERADAGAGDGGYAGNDPQHFREGERHQRKIGPFQPRSKAQRADHGPDQGACGNTHEEAEPRVDAVVYLQDGGRIGAGAEEGGVTERILPAISAEQVPALAHERDQKRDHQEVEHDVG